MLEIESDKRGSRILAIRPGALGDTILTMPAIRALRLAAGPSGRIELVGNLTPLRLALNPHHANAVHSIDRRLFVGLFSEPMGADLREYLMGFDLVVAWFRDDKGHLTRLTKQWSLTCIQNDPSSAATSSCHASEHLVGTLKSLGIEGPASLPELFISREADSAGDAFLRQTKIREGRFLAIHPGSGAPRKNWHTEGFSQLALMAKDSGLDVLLIEGEADQRAAEALRSALPHESPVARNLDLEVLAAVLSRARAYVGNDSGISHLAAAAGAPTLALFGPTDPKIWAPRGPRVEVLPQVSEAARVWMRLRELSGW